jgi:hypothetical protein
MCLMPPSQQPSTIVGGTFPRYDSFVPFSIINHDEEIDEVCANFMGEGWESHQQAMSIGLVFDSNTPTYTGYSPVLFNGTSESLEHGGCWNGGNNGARPICTFTGFSANANPVQCCLQNMFCTKNDPQNSYLGMPGVFDENCHVVKDGKSYMCDFSYRRLGDNGYCWTDDPKITSLGCNSCYSQVGGWCTAPQLGINDLVQRWIAPSYPVNPDDPASSFVAPCASFMMRTIYSSEPSTDPDNAVIECSAGIMSLLNQSPPPRVLNPANFINAKRIFTTAVQQYIAKGGQLDALPGQGPSSTEFNEFVYNVCSSYPAMCDDLLTGYCSNKTTDDLLRNPSSATFCGCYLNPVVYEEVAGRYGINRECSSYCAADGVIPLSNGTVDGAKQCDQSVCLIDNVSIDLVKSRITGAISLGNLCTGCTSSGTGSATSCSCVLSNITVTGVNSEINTINLNQACGSSVCYRAVGNNEKVAVDCDTGELISTEEASSSRRAIIVQVLKIIGIILLFVVLIIVFYIVISPNTIVPKPIIPKYPPSLPAVAKRPQRSILDR